MSLDLWGYDHRVAAHDDWLPTVPSVDENLSAACYADWCLDKGKHPFDLDTAAHYCSGYGEASDAKGIYDWIKNHLPGHHTAARLAMPEGGWYHASPHELPVGTTLTPGGGESAFAAVYRDHLGPELQSHVWLADSRNIAGWVDRGETGLYTKHVYRVEPSDTPRLYNENDPHMGWVVPSARIVEKIPAHAVPPYDPFDDDEDDHPHTASRLAMPWYHVSPHDIAEGDDLLPRGVGSLFDDSLYSEEGNEWRGEHVWVTDHINNAKAWQDQIEQETGTRPHNIYEVEPHGRPEQDLEDNYYDAPPGFFTDRATIKKKLSNQKEAQIMTAAVTVYTKPDCPQCTMTKKQLDKLGIDHDTVDVTQDPDAHAYVTGLGYASAPVVVVNDGESHWSGFRPDHLRGLVE
jgi:glutaredoxin-like protein NrdH